MAELEPLRDTITRHGLWARRALGQHFLLDRNLTGRIARAAGDLGDGTTIEIGPGPGGLTRSLLAEGAAHVIAVEPDARCIAALSDLAAAYPGRLAVREADALTLTLGELGPPPRRVVANLPYNVATDLLLRWLLELAADGTAAAGFTLMFQKEVADRLVATPRTKAYSRLSIITQWLCDARVLFTVPPRAFTPPPKVWSSVVRLVPRDAPRAPADPDVLQRVTAAAFGQRRKMLRQSLKPLGDPADLARRAGIDPTARPEQLSVEQVCALARAVADTEDAGGSGSSANS